MTDSGEKIYCIVGYNTSIKTHRCFGYYITYDSAVDSLKKQWKDIEECLYDSFFIEEFKEGLQPLGKIIDYYEINDSQRNLVKRETPSEIRSFVNWSIG
jgi:hypothetical protein